MEYTMAQVLLGHTMAQSTVELLALIGPFAIVFGVGAFLVINPIIKSGAEPYEHAPPASRETPPATGRADEPSASREPAPRAEEAAAAPVPGGH